MPMLPGKEQRGSPIKTDVRKGETKTKSSNTSKCGQMDQEEKALQTDRAAWAKAD